MFVPSPLLVQNMANPTLPLCVAFLFPMKFSKRIVYDMVQKNIYICTHFFLVLYYGIPNSSLVFFSVYTQVF